jgi:Uma2 family endonuclease
MDVNTTLMTADGLFMLPASGGRYEVVPGELRRMTPAGSAHGVIVMHLSLLLGQFVKAHALGRVFGAETGFKIATDPETVRAPDLALVRRDGIPDSGVPAGLRPGTPDLAAEVIAPGDTYADVEEKVNEWLNTGTGMVSEVTRLTVADILTGGDVLPGLPARCQRGLHELVFL